MSLKDLVLAFVNSAQMMLQSSSTLNDEEMEKTLEEFGRDEIIEDEVYIQQRDQLFEEYGYEKIEDVVNDNLIAFISQDENGAVFYFLKDEPNMLKFKSMLKFKRDSEVVIDMYDLDVLDYILANIMSVKKEVV